MLTSVEGLYQKGIIEISEIPTDIPDGTRVIVTFLKPSEVDLESYGINKAQAEILRTSLTTFTEDWDSPEMGIYDNYEAAKNH